MSTANESADTADTETEPEEQTDDYELPRHFVITASGPATKKTAVSENVTEREELDDVHISRTIDTLDDFAQFYNVRQNSVWKKAVIRHLLDEECADEVAYTFDPDDWDVQLDGRVEAYLGVVDILADPDTVIRDADDRVTVDSPTHTKDATIGKELADIHVGLVHTDTKTRDDAFKRLAQDCHREELFGPGATLAYIDAENAELEDISGYVEAFHDDLTGER